MTKADKATDLQTEWNVLIERCNAIQHISDPQFGGLAKITTVCLEIERLIAEGTLGAGDSRLVGLFALQEVMDRGPDLDEAEADVLHDVVGATFSNQVAMAALRGRLIWGLTTNERSPAPTISETRVAHEHRQEIASFTVAESVQGSEGSVHRCVNSVSIIPTISLCSAISIADTFTSFKEFEAEYWLDNNGTVSPTPWRDPEYRVALSSIALAAWNNKAYGTAYAHFISLDSLNVATPVSVQDLDKADELLSDPTLLHAGVEPGRIERLRALLDGTPLIPCDGLRLTIMLEAVRPTLPLTLSSQEIEQLIGVVGFNNPAVASVTSWMLNAWAAGSNPLPQLKSALAEVAEDPQALHKELARAEAAYRETVATLWSAAGGRLRQTHSRKAWSRFIQEQVAPWRAEFGNASRTLQQAVTLNNRIRGAVTRMRAEYPQIMAEVRFQDRVAADSAVEQIVEVMYQLADVLHRVGVQQKQLKNSFDGCPREDLRRLLAEPSCDGTEGLCATILSAALGQVQRANPLQIDSTIFLACPDLVKYVTPHVLEEWHSTIPVRAFSEHHAASALLVNSLPEVASDDVLADLKEAVTALGRRDILSMLSPWNVFGSHERTLLLKAGLEVDERLFVALQELEELGAIYDMLMIEDEAALRHVIDDAKKHVTRAETMNSLVDGPLIEAWMQSNIAMARRTVSEAKEVRIRVAAELSPESGEAIEKLLEEGRYRDAVALLHDIDWSQTATMGSSARETMWRSEAVKEFTEPLGMLQALGGISAELAARWVEAAMDAGQREAARRALYTFVSREDDTKRSPDLPDYLKRSVVKLGDLRDHLARRTVIDARVLRDYFQRAGLNPTFLPQLADISKIVLTTAGAAASHPGAVLDECARLVASEPKGALVAFVEPGLSLSRRDELCDGLRRRGILAAVVDDVDVCRLCASGEHPNRLPFVGLLEIVLEQIELSRASPFSTQDGQHVRVESFVGRAKEAEDLALRNRYSCVFSGRKLGKSALLKYVTRKYNGHPLTSGNTLSVIFITIAGGESELWVVQCIIDEMVKRFDLPEEDTAGANRPRDRLSSYMQRFVRSRPDDSVLLVLDEADTFVEGQLANYDNDREASLSFCLLKELPAVVDSTDLPRIRTIFSGYRVTNTRDGVWANAGDPLVLNPLHESEAISFVTGTLARIGIDIGSNGPYIARRCGGQPAVLIRFGEILLKHLSRSSQGIGRESITVSEALISAALTDHGVQDEIRTVVANNFQGYKVGQAVFNATVAALKELAPGQALEDAPAQVLKKLREIDPDMGWLESLNASPSALVEQNLQNFVERDLLAVSEGDRFGARKYRMKVPHFLPVLAQSETALETRQLIGAIRNSSKQSLLNRCSLSETSLEKLRYWYRQPNVDNCRLIVVGGHWVTSLRDDRCGVPVRLGCADGDVLCEPSTDRIPSLVGNGTRVFINPTLDAWPVLLALHQLKPIVVIGDVAWLRTALQYVLDGGDVPVEVIGQGRMAQGALIWWIERARALHPSSSLPTEIFYRSTHGVPLLVEAFDRFLKGGLAEDLPDEVAKDAEKALHAHMPALAANLRVPGSADFLTPREHELLSMAVRVGQELEGGEYDIETEFSSYWELCTANDPKVSAPWSEPGDRLALQLLVNCGLLTVADEGRAGEVGRLGKARIDPAGPLARLVAAMEATNAH